MSHELSETVQDPTTGRWLNISGYTRQPLEPGVTYPTVEEAVTAAKQRSASFNTQGGHSGMGVPEDALAGSTLGQGAPPAPAPYSDDPYAAQRSLAAMAPQELPQGQGIEWSQAGPPDVSGRPTTIPGPRMFAPSYGAISPEEAARRGYKREGGATVTARPIPVEELALMDAGAKYRAYAAASDAAAQRGDMGTMRSAEGYAQAALQDYLKLSEAVNQMRAQERMAAQGGGVAGGEGAAGVTQPSVTYVPYTDPKSGKVLYKAVTSEPPKGQESVPLRIALDEAYKKGLTGTAALDYAKRVQTQYSSQLAAGRAGAAKQAGIDVGAQGAEPGLTNLEKQTATAQARATGSTLGGAPTAESVTALANIANVQRVISHLQQSFTPEDVRKYTGILRSKTSRAGQFLRGVVGLPGDPRFAQFQTLLGQLRGTAFGEGGKQLTPFEAGVVFNYTPSGFEATPEDFFAKVQQLKERFGFLQDARTRLAKATRGNIGELSQRLADLYEGKYGNADQITAAGDAWAAAFGQGLRGDALYNEVSNATGGPGGGLTTAPQPSGALNIRSIRRVQ